MGSDKSYICKWVPWLFSKQKLKNYFNGGDQTLITNLFRICWKKLHQIQDVIDNISLYFVIPNHIQLLWSYWVQKFLTYYRWQKLMVASRGYQGQINHTRILFNCNYHSIYPLYFYIISYVISGISC